MQLDLLAKEYWQRYLAFNPTAALLLGYPDHLAEMEDASLEAEDAALSAFTEIAEAARAIDPHALSLPERITREVLISEAANLADELSSRFAELGVDPVSGFHVQLLQLVGQIRLTAPEQASGLLEKWSKVGITFDQLIERLRQGVAHRRTPPRSAVEKVIAQIDQYLGSDLDGDPFAAVPAPPGLADEATWRDRLADQVRSSIRPSYQRLRRYLAEELVASARPPEQSGLCWLADGEEIYTRAIRRHTTLDASAEELRDLGLDVTEQLADEYRQLGKEVLGEDDLAIIYERLRHDLSLRFENSEQIVSAAQGAMDRAAATISSWFGRLPKAGCVMAEIGAAAADSTLAFYLPPAADGSRPGTYFVNTTQPTTRTRYEAEVLAFHESIPGHHLQLAIAQELAGIPEFQRHAQVTPYVEGWGLYTERLADEMGLYSHALARMGMLSFDSWRAGRLVVDTGIHAFRWSRQQAIDWLAGHSPQALNNIENEVDRYIGWPGQALAYMTGRREIVRLRHEAERRLGARFDVRSFHDLLLGSGPVPLPTLGWTVEEWIETR